jgi:hypothetical protein
MTLQGIHASRQHRMDLLARPPSGVEPDEARWAALLIDATDQLEALADLVARGLLSPEEFEHQKAKVIGR